MGPMASPQTITIISNARLLSVSKPDAAPAMPALPKYAVGLFDSKTGPGPRKRKRLTHLTPEEKIMRRKLKNRVAAQTARDRKKMKLETLEETILKVQSQARELLNVNMQLLERAENLENENKMLREKLGIKSCGGANVVTNQKHNLQRIKTEFDETLLSAEAEMNQPDIEINIPDSILSPDESSADENDVGGNNTSTSRKRSAATASHRDEKRQRRQHNPSPCEGDQVAPREVPTVTRGEEGVLVAGGNHGNDSGCGGSRERASPVPAVYSEYRNLVVFNSQQQDSTIRLPLIRSLPSPHDPTSVTKYPKQPGTPPHPQPSCSPLPMLLVSKSREVEVESSCLNLSQKDVMSPVQMSYSDCSTKSQMITTQTGTPLDLTRKVPLR